ncbi:DnaT-like ssDNA-binding domain-containing protein [Enterobacter soli]|nr:DnaT-like ssDNA-binding domain-containing protein [Enterobacter soli]
MARIRTVKPEFWTDEKVVECSIPARLLFIGLFNFANDLGCLERSPKRFKMQILPADSIDCEPLIRELITQGLLIEYSVNGGDYLCIKGFSKHQKINRPSATKIPLPPEFTEPAVKSEGEITEGSVSPRGVINEPSPTDTDTDTEGKGITPSFNEREGKSSDQPNQGEPQKPRYLEGLDEPIGKFTMSGAWLPSRDFRQRAAMWGIALPVPDYLATELAEFVSYWESEGKVFTQIQWEQKFARHVQLVRTKQKPQSGGTDNAAVRSEPTTSRAVQQIQSAHAEWRRRNGLDGNGDSVAVMAGDGGNILKPLDAEEWGRAYGPLDSSDRFDD